jgi:hypothetical protein
VGTQACFPTRAFEIASQSCRQDDGAPARSGILIFFLQNKKAKDLFKKSPAFLKFNAPGTTRTCDPQLSLPHLVSQALRKFLRLKVWTIS